MSLIPIIITADDFGLSNGICNSIISLLEKKAVTSTSIMIAAPNAILRTKQYMSDVLIDKAGVHLQVTSGTPLSPKTDVPTLIDSRTGVFLPKHLIVEGHPDQVYLEWKRQIETVSDLLGRLPLHIDSHHGMHRKVGFQEQFVQLAYEYGLCCRGGSRELHSSLGYYGISHSNLLLKKWTGKKSTFPSFTKEIIESKSLVSSNLVVEIISHPGHSDDYLNSVSSLSEQRNVDHSLLIKLHKTKWLKANGFMLSGYNDIFKLQQQGDIIGK